MKTIKTVIVYKCDICGKEMEENENVSHLKAAGEQVDLCPDCISMLIRKAKIEANVALCGDTSGGGKLLEQTPDTVSMSSKCKAVRSAAKLTQDEYAKLLGVSNFLIYCIENNKRNKFFTEKGIKARKQIEKDYDEMIKNAK